MKYKLTIECDNAAFEERPNGDEIGYILRKLAASIDGVEMAVGAERPLIDTYGNLVGTARMVAK